MHINNTLQGIAGAYMQNVNQVKVPQRQANNPYASAGQDEFLLSKEARNFSSSLQRLKMSADDVRADKVAYFEAQIANGTYQIDSQGIAEKMMSMRY